MKAESDSVDREWVLGQLMHSLRALASPAEVQVTLFPSFACQADELALEFDNFYRGATQNFGSEFSEESLSLLESIDLRFREISCGGELFTEDLWTPDGLRNSQHWAWLRTRARAALVSIGWPVSPLREWTGKERVSTIPKGRLTSGSS